MAAGTGNLDTKRPALPRPVLSSLSRSYMLDDLLRLIFFCEEKIFSLARYYRTMAAETFAMARGECELIVPRRLTAGDFELRFER